MKTKIANVSLSEYPPNKSQEGDQTAPRLYICTSCRQDGVAKEPKENRDGLQLYMHLKKLLKDQNLSDKVNLLPVECLSLCRRPCGIALSSFGSWTYRFGDAYPTSSSQDIIDFVQTYIHSNDGNILRGERPKSLRSSILGKVPPNTN